MIGALRNILITLTILILVMFAFLRILHAESDQVTVGSANAKLDFQIKVPQMLYLQLGSPGGVIDTVNFYMDSQFGSGPVDGDYEPQFEFTAIIPTGQTVTLAADSSNPLVGISNGQTIPMSRISFSGTGDLSSVQNVSFNNTSNQLIWQGTGSGRRIGGFSYVYTPSFFQPFDDFEGQVTYTLSVP